MGGAGLALRRALDTRRDEELAPGSEFRLVLLGLCITSCPQSLNHQRKLAASGSYSLKAGRISRSKWSHLTAGRVGFSQQSGLSLPKGTEQGSITSSEPELCSQRLQDSGSLRRLMAVRRRSLPLTAAEILEAHSLIQRALN